jgi:hypothetical protein
MNILAVSGAAYLPPRGGSTRSNRAWLEQLAAHGHVCRVLAPSLGGADDVGDEPRRHADLGRKPPFD